MTTPKFRADFADQTGWFNPDDFVETLTVIGLGGIGASVLPTLVTLGFRRFTLWDDDVVEPRNIASQLLYRPSDLYQPKAEVCRKYLLDYGATDVEIVRQKFTAADTVDSSVVISGVDSMAARQEVWKAIAASDAQLYLDGRIGGLFMTLLAVEPFDAGWYQDHWLFNDSEAAELPCAQRTIAHPAVALGGFMAAHLVNWHRGLMPPKRVDLNLGGDLFFQVVGRRS